MKVSSKAVKAAVARPSAVSAPGGSGTVWNPYASGRDKKPPTVEKEDLITCTFSPGSSVDTQALINQASLLLGLPVLVEFQSPRPTVQL